MSKSWGGDMEISLGSIQYHSLNQNSLSGMGFYGSGRQAFKSIIERLDPTTTYHVPYYLCEDVQSVVRDQCKHVRYYDNNIDLTVNTSELLSQLSYDTIQAILLIDYFGLKSHEELAATIKKKFPHTIIIQDISHLSFIPHMLGLSLYYGDYVFGSLRKVFPVPDGGFVEGDPLSGKKYSEDCLNVVDIKLAGKLLKNLFIHNSEFRKEEIDSMALGLSNRAEKLFAQQLSYSDISTISKIILHGTNYMGIYKQRRENYSVLREAIIKTCPSCDLRIASELSAGMMPYQLPVLFPNMIIRNRMRDKLVRAGVFCSIIWELDPAVHSKGGSEALKISKKILSLPVDQRYRTEDMLCIAKIFSGIYKDIAGTIP